MKQWPRPSSGPELARQRLRRHAFVPLLGSEAIISDPWVCWDMTFSIHIGANAPTDPPVLKVGAGCQPGAKCTLCGCCGRREAYLEVNDPKNDNKTAQTCNEEGA
ncbi:unnamed protein product [Effrenium voratum]|nr:unnamed protein product [Effrenium voratum]